MLDRDDIDRLRPEATKRRMNWGDGSSYANWRQEVGGHVRAIWYTLSDEQKLAIACDAKERARNAEEAAELRQEQNTRDW